MSMMPKEILKVVESVLAIFEHHARADHTRCTNEFGPWKEESCQHNREEHGVRGSESQSRV